MSRRTARRRSFWFLVLTLAALAGSAAAQESRCADCHFANPSPAPEHLTDWQLSAHARNGVGCEACHGGDSSTFDIMLAHQGLHSGGNPSSPVHYLNLPATCGKCHVGQLKAFRRSQHMGLLEAGDESAPSCSTCHSNAGSFLLSSRGLERTCQRCHGENKRAPRPERPQLAGDLHQRVVAVREQLRSARRMIRKVKSDDRRAQLELSYQQAETPLVEAIETAHDFTFAEFEERIAMADKRAGDLVELLANP